MASLPVKSVGGIDQEAIKKMQTQANTPNPGFDPSKIRQTNNPYDPNLYNASFSQTPTGQVSDNLYSADPSTRLAQTYMNQYYSGGNRERGMPGTYKLYENEANKVALKKSLAGSINDAPKNLDEEVGLLRGDAGQALDQGLTKTRQNFNNRGLLYSGLREGGEQQVRGRVASALAESESGARRDTENLLTERKKAFASIGLAEQEQKNQMAQQAFEKSYQNSIARRQAMQQLGTGVGQAVGYYMNSQPNSQNTQAQSPSMENMSVSSGSYNSPSYSAPSYATQPPRLAPAS